MANKTLVVFDNGRTIKVQREEDGGYLLQSGPENEPAMLWMPISKNQSAQIALFFKVDEGD